MTELIISFLVTLLGIGMIRGYFIRRKYQTLIGKVTDIDESRVGYYKATIMVPDHGEITVDYKDADTYELGQEVNCMWDGKNEVSVAPDVRQSLLVGGLIAITIGIYLVVHYLYIK
jgi:hypothetical protein